MKVEPNVVITEFIINVDNYYHIIDNSNVNIEQKVQRLAQSLSRFKVPLYTLTNSDEEKDEDGLHIIHMDLTKEYTGLTVFFHRLILAFQFLQAHPEIEKAIISDASDVTMLNYPFDSMEEGKLYMGDEWGIMGDTYVLYTDHNPFFIKKFIAENQLLPTMNMGIIAGTREILIEYLGIIIQLISDSQVKVQQGDNTAALGNHDMELGNYVAYRYFADRLVHGRKINTIFQGFQSISSAWLEHK